MDGVKEINTEKDEVLAQDDVALRVIKLAQDDVASRVIQLALPTTNNQKAAELRTQLDEIRDNEKSFRGKDIISPDRKVSDK